MIRQDNFSHIVFDFKIVLDIGQTLGQGTGENLKFLFSLNYETTFYPLDKLSKIPK
jgi:hypothetical protein